MDMDTFANTMRSLETLQKQLADLWNENQRLKRAINDPEKFVEIYNRLIEEENKANEDDGWQPHENI